MQVKTNKVVLLKAGWSYPTWLMTCRATAGKSTLAVASKRVAIKRIAVAVAHSAIIRAEGSCCRKRSTMASLT